MSRVRQIHSRYKAWLDQDGVLTDWIDAFKDYLPQLADKVHYGQFIKEDWFALLDYNFWRWIPWQRWAKDLLTYVYQIQGEVAIISRLPPHMTAEAMKGKIEAVLALEKELGFPIELQLVKWDEPKFIHKLCKPYDLLIDDMGKECREWETAGGKAFQFHLGFVEEYTAVSINTYKKGIKDWLAGTYVGDTYMPMEEQ